MGEVQKCYYDIILEEVLYFAIKLPTEFKQRFTCFNKELDYKPLSILKLL